ncbi:hypothetical protein C8R44DRAFT_725796 [Mycena epipterygia]|nr:hypothetical protein C8R44DRAFT_725796 [Mycena epipterygia]
MLFHGAERYLKVGRLFPPTIVVQVDHEFLDVVGDILLGSACHVDEKYGQNWESERFPLLQPPACRPGGAVEHSRLTVKQVCTRGGGEAPSLFCCGDLSALDESNYYRDHTRQQDGWTVLALPPDLPPPYEQAAAPASAAAPTAVTGTLLSFHIPTNTNVIGAVQVTRSKKYGRKVPFNTAFVEMCNIMGLDPSTAAIGYKWDNDKVNAPNPPEETGAVTKASGKKRKAPDGPSSSSSSGRKTFDFTSEYRALKNHLLCASHKGKHCFVHHDGHHIGVEPDHISLWAKEISVGNATQARPPENLIFQKYFLPEQHKKARNSEASSNPGAPAIPSIHVTVNTGGTSSSTVTPASPSGTARARVPLAPITAATANAANFDVPPLSTWRGPDNSSSGSSPIYYPSVVDVLEAIDVSGVFEDSPTLTFPVVIFADALHSFQITQVDHVPILDPQFYVDQVDMPWELAELFVDQSLDAVERATAERSCKGKGKAA